MSRTLASGWRRASVAAVACAILLAAPGAAGPARAQTATLTLTQLQNATYPDALTASGMAPLANGAYSEPAAPGSASLVQVQFIDAAIAPDFAAVVLASSGGGSGTFYTLHLVTLSNGAPDTGAGVQLGDRIRLNSISIADNQIRLDMVAHAPTDPLCCPTQAETRIYGFTASGFGLLSTTPAAAPSAPAPAATGMAGDAATHRTGDAARLALLAAAVLVAGGGRRLTRRRRRAARD